MHARCFMRAALWRLCLRLAQILRDELDLARREPLGCLLIALVEQGFMQGLAAFYPTHEAIYGHVWVGKGEINEGKLLLGVGQVPEKVGKVCRFALIFHVAGGF